MPKKKRETIGIGVLLNEIEGRFSRPMRLFSDADEAQFWVSMKNHDLEEEESWRGKHGWRATIVWLDWSNE